MFDVTVLLAAYNGEKYISEQLDSIINQVNVSLKILISIDKSNDSTLEICKKYCSKHDFIKIISFNEKFGSPQDNFYSLINKCNINSSYFALSDQDDIWLPDKLYNACYQLNTGCDLYSSNLLAFYMNGKQNLIKKHLPDTPLSHIFESNSAGCTYVFTSKLKDKIKFCLNDKKFPYINAHDLLISYICTKYNFKSCKDINSYILYRQHDNNVAGSNKGINGLMNRIRPLFFGWYNEDVSNLFTDYMLHHKKSLDILFLFRNIFNFRRVYIHSFIIFLLLIFKFIKVKKRSFL